MLCAARRGPADASLGVDALAALGTSGDEDEVAEAAVPADAIRDDRVLLARAAVDDHESCRPLNAHARQMIRTRPMIWLALIRGSNGS